MVSLTCTTSREQGVTLVTARVENAGELRRVRLRSRLDGPVWPPRRRGVPAAGWTHEGFECVLDTDETRALGFASPAPPVDPPLAVAETTPVDGEDDPDFEPDADVPAVEGTPTGVVRALGSARPPRDAVPTPDPPEIVTGSDTSTRAVGTQSDDGSSVEPTETTSFEGTREDTTVKHEQFPTGDVPVETVEDWLDAVEGRLELAEALSETAHVERAADALERLGGVEGTRELDAAIDRDAAALERVADRATALADRAETTVAVETIERLR